MTARRPLVILIVVALCTLISYVSAQGSLSPQGDITAVSATSGGGLEGGAVAGAASLGLVTTCQTSEVLAWDGNSWECSSVAGGAGDITSVVAGSGLSGGATSGAATLDVSTGTGITITGDAVTLNMTGASCAASEAVTAIGATGTGTCSTVGDITGVTAGTNMSGGGASGAVTLNVSDSPTFSGSVTVQGNTTLGNAATDTITFLNGPTGVNGYDGTSFEWNEEWLSGAIAPTASANWPLGGNWLASANGTGLFTAGVGTTTRPGIIEFGTSTSATGRSSIGTNPALIDFNSGSWTFEAVVGFPTLSVVAQEYAALIGFLDDVTSVNQVDGCYFLYDRAGTATDPGTGADGTGDTWKCWCASNSTRTGYLMNGVAVSDESFTTVSQSVAALTLPSTNIYRLKIVMTGTTRAEFYVNGTKSCNISTNIPSGSARLTGAAHTLIKSNGTTSRTMDLDFTRLAVTLNAARSP